MERNPSPIALVRLYCAPSRDPFQVKRIDNRPLSVNRAKKSKQREEFRDFSFSFDSIGSRCGVSFVWRLIKIGNVTQICLIPKEKERKVSEQRLNERVNS